MRGSAPRDRRDDGHFVAVLNGGREAAAEAHVFVVQIEVDEGIGLSLLVLKPGRGRASAPAAVTPPAVSANTPVSSARKRIPSTSSASLTAAAQPPVSRIARAAKAPSAGLPIASDRQMVLGNSGSIASLPRSTRRTIGAQPAACVPYS